MISIAILNMLNLAENIFRNILQFNAVWLKIFMFLLWIRKCVANKKVFILTEQLYYRICINDIYWFAEQLIVIDVNSVPSYW